MGKTCKKGSSLADYVDQQLCSPWPYKILLQPFIENVCGIFLSSYSLENILNVAVFKNLNIYP